MESGTKRRRAVAAVFAITIYFAFTGTGPASASSGPTVEHDVTATPAEVDASWDTADLIGAIPADTAPQAGSAFDVPHLPDASISATAGDFDPGDASAYPLSLQGKVFFRIGLTEYSCSGTLVDSRNANSIFTAGHCVFDQDTKSFVTDLIFVPGYANGFEPFGRYAATGLLSTEGWTSNGDYDYDVGAATLAGTPVADLGGGRKIAFDLNPTGRRFTLYGYPGDPSPYDGERLVACRTRVVARDKGSPRPLGASPCGMGHGASGGGWITNGYLNSVFSYIYCDTDPKLCGYVFGPYFSTAVRNLYTSDAVGGSITPTLTVKYNPPHLVTKRKVLFKFAGEGSTPIGFRCKFDHRGYVDCPARTTISRLTPGRHLLRVRSVDQTGRLSPNTITRRFRVSLK